MLLLRNKIIVAGQLYFTKKIIYCFYEQSAYKNEYLSLRASLFFFLFSNNSSVFSNTAYCKYIVTGTVTELVK